MNNRKPKKRAKRKTIKPVTRPSSPQHCFPFSTQHTEMCRDKVEKLLLQAGRAMDLSLCFHDRLNRVAIRPDLKTHRSSYCRRIKQRHEPRCIEFDFGSTHQNLAGLPEGCIQTCPFGVTEIAVPVFANGVYIGVLFAGSCWSKRRIRPPDSSLVVPPTRNWLPDRLLLVQSIARELGALLAAPGTQNQRSERALEYLRSHLTEPIYLTALSRHLSLSPSRTRHLMKEMFGVRFSTLVIAIKIEEAARLLRITDLTVSEIAVRVGFANPNYLSRIFRHTMNSTPRDYRQIHRMTP